MADRAQENPAVERRHSDGRGFLFAMSPDLTPMKSVVIVGAGAMGCLFAARLAEAGVQVALVDVDRGRLDALNRDGITIEDDRGARVVRVTACTASQATEAPDLVLLFTKSLH